MDAETGGDGGYREIRKIQSKFRLKKAEFFDCEEKRICIIRLMNFSESDTRAKYIDPKLQECGWSESFLVREYYFTNGRKFVGSR